MKKICYIIAMRTEARPLTDHFGLQHSPDFFAPLPCQLYHGTVGGSELYVVQNGVQHDRDLIGCEAAAVTTMAAIERLKPDIIISSGTCGGWQRYGAEVGRVYLGDGVMFHDRRVPGDNLWATQGLGNYPVWDGTAALAQQLGMMTGKVTTGSSFDMKEEEEAVIDENGGRLKEMEGAAVGFVCSLFHVPSLFVKAVTNLRDKDDDDMETFHDNLRHASEELLKANIRIMKILTEQEVTADGQ
jgi:5'-methylthioadenosine nucleosidase